MKGKELLSLLLLTLFVFSIIAIPSMAKKSKHFSGDTTTLGVGDYEFFTADNLTCTKFNVTVDISGVTNMRGCAIKLGYNATLLHAIRVYPTAITATTTDWLPVDKYGAFHFDDNPTINNTRTYAPNYAYVWVSAWGFTLFTGSGPVFTIEFHIIKAPTGEPLSCVLDLFETEVLDRYADQIPHNVDDGLYLYSPPFCLVTFYTDPSTVGSISFNGETYTNGQSDTFPKGSSGKASANAPAGWVFDYWESTGNVFVSDIYDNPTDITIECGGTLTAIFKPQSNVVITSFYVRPSCFSPNGDGKKDTTLITAMFTTQPDVQPIPTTSVEWTLRVKTVITYTKRTWVGTDGTVNVIWDGKDDAGKVLPDGEYMVLLQGRDKDGNLTKIESKLVVIDTVPPTITGVSDSPDPFKPSTGETTTISYTLSEKCYVTIKITDIMGGSIRILRATQPAGPNSMIWDGTLGNQGIIVPDGTYIYRIDATDMSGNEATPKIGTVGVAS